MKEADEKLAEEIETLENALDSHSKDNRDKRKTLQERRTGLSKRMDLSLPAIRNLAPNIPTRMTRLSASVFRKRFLCGSTATTTRWSTTGSTSSMARKSVCTSRPKRMLKATSTVSSEACATDNHYGPHQSIEPGRESTREEAIEKEAQRDRTKCRRSPMET
jgi:hypothetical protein